MSPEQIKALAAFNAALCEAIANAAPHLNSPVMRLEFSLAMQQVGPRRLRVSPEHPYAQQFERFWQAYPKKVNKSGCITTWSHQRLDKCVDAIVADIELRRQTEDWQKAHGKYVPHPQTYLNQRRWEDEVNVAEVKRSIFAGAV